jgi:O-antigen ligase
MWPAGVAILWLAAIAVSDMNGVDPWGGLLGEFQRFQGLLPSVVYVILAAGTALAVRGSGNTRLIAAGLFLGAVLSAAYVAVAAVGLGWVNWQSGATDRAVGLFGQPNVLGVQLVCGGMAGLGLLGTSRERGHEPIAVGLAGVAAVLILTFSRAAWVGAIAGTAVLFVLDAGPPRISGRIAATALGAILVAVFAMQLVPSSSENFAMRQGFMDTGSQSTRVGLWKTGVEMLRDRPLIGSGPDSFPLRFGEYRHEDQPGIGAGAVRAESSHSLILDHLIDTGILGTALYLTLIVTVLATVTGRLRGRRDPVTAGLVAALAAYFAATSFSFAESITGWIPWVLLGALAGAAPTPGQILARHDVSRSAAAIAGAALLASGVVLFTADLFAGEAESRLETDPSGSPAFASRARRLNPLAPHYREVEAQALLGADRPGEAEQVLERLNGGSPPTHYASSRRPKPCTPRTRRAAERKR